MVKKIYVDLDGTLVNFGKGATLAGWITYETDKGDSENEGWKKIKNTPHFYANLEPIEGAIEFFNDLVRIYGKDRVEILTGVPSEKRGIPTAGDDKITWCKKYLPEGIKVNLCKRADKKNYCKGKNYVLIDDLDTNCKEWADAGGTAIKFKSVNETEKLLYENKIMVQPNICTVFTSIDLMGKPTRLEIGFQTFNHELCISESEISPIGIEFGEDRILNAKDTIRFLEHYHKGNYTEIDLKIFMLQHFEERNWYHRFDDMCKELGIINSSIVLQRNLDNVITSCTSC